MVMIPVESSFADALNTLKREGVSGAPVFQDDIASVCQTHLRPRIPVLVRFPVH